MYSLGGTQLRGYVPGRRLPDGGCTAAGHSLAGGYTAAGLCARWGIVLTGGYAAAGPCVAQAYKGCLSKRWALLFASAC